MIFILDATVIANGVWQYGELPDLTSPATSFGVYTLTTLTYDGVAGFSGYYATGGLPMVLGNFASPPATIVDGSVHLPVGFLEMHPGSSGQYSAVRFVAPAAGVYGFAGQFQGQDSGGTSTDVHILRIAAATSTSTSLFSASVIGYYGGDGGSPSGTSPIAPLDLSGVALAAGDSVLFVVGDGGGTYYADSTGLQVTATIGASGSPAADDPFGYLGGLGYWQDPALADTAGSGLSYVRQRWLENATGQWLSVDPVASELRYGYARNMPTIRVDPGGTLSVPINVATFASLLPARAQSEFLHLQANFANANAILTQAILKLASIEQMADSQFEAARRNLPPIIANLSPPEPWHLIEMGEWIAGMVWGAVQSLFGLIPIVGMIPDFINFIEYLVKDSSKNNIFTSVGHYFTEQWNGFVAMFTKVSDATPFDRGQLFGSLLVNLVVAVIAVILTFITGGASLAVAFEEEGQDLVKVAARLARAGRVALKNAPKTITHGVLADTRSLAAHVGEVASAVREQRLPSGLVKVIEPLQRLHSEGRLNIQELKARAERQIREEIKEASRERPVGEGHRRSAFNPISPEDKEFIISEFKEIGGDPHDLVFDSVGVTGYRDATNKINIRGDVFPGTVGISANSKLSVRATLAHELAHKKFVLSNARSLQPGNWLDEYRASMWAAKNTPNLSEVDRALLTQDALDRAASAGEKIQRTSAIRRLLGF